MNKLYEKKTAGPHNSIYAEVISGKINQTVNYYHTSPEVCDRLSSMEKKIEQLATFINQINRDN